MQQAIRAVATPFPFELCSYSRAFIDYPGQEVSRAELDTEFGHRSAELGWRAAPAELFLKRLAVCRRPGVVPIR